MLVIHGNRGSDVKCWWCYDRIVVSDDATQTLDGIDLRQQAFSAGLHSWSGGHMMRHDDSVDVRKFSSGGAVLG